MKHAMPLVVAAALAAACASDDAKRDGAVTDRSGAAPSASAQATPRASTSTPARPGAVAGNPLQDPNRPLAKRSVYFDYDSNVVKDEYRGLVQAHSRYMAERGTAKVRIEGNCDERGSREYNLALGQRRADAIKQMMQLLGVQAAQVETVSFGEEKPRCKESAESCWSQNRRGDIAYQGE